LNSPVTLNRLLVFARDPVPRRVKTRLIPALGVAGATDVYRQMLQDTLATAARADGARCELWIDGADRGSATVALARDLGMSIHTQQGADIGARMFAALGEALGRAQCAVLIGTDCPEFDKPHIEAAFRTLQTHDAVLGPAADGGYVLIGLRTAAPSVFEQIPWGSDQVLAATRERFGQLHWDWFELPTLHDVDEAADLPRFPQLCALADASRTSDPHE
jgi:hypothetical protein